MGRSSGGASLAHLHTLMHIVLSFPLRATVAVAIGCALVTGWLQPVYEMFIIRQGVSVPGWWIALHLSSLAVLFFLCFFLLGRNPRLCILAWCAFWLSVVANIVPGMA